MRSLEAPALLEAILPFVRRAGERLRAELHRPGGPRGRGDQAEIDGEIELFLREAVAQIAPLDGVRGEEHPQLDRAPQAGAGLWLIDPNDGTGPFLRRQRGASVSIARLVAGEPQLGVVYSYAWPDDHGTLLSWAQGAGPVLRDGVPVTEGGGPAIWWLSNRAEAHAASISQVLAQVDPQLRFMPGPGIAFRLAQVAAGAGQLAVSLFAPRDFDIAGGHALLRGRGFAAHGVEGQPLRAYDMRQPSRLSALFAGQPQALAQMVGLRWGDLQGLVPEASDEFGPLAPGGAALCAEVQRLQRAQGAWLGLLIGAAAGSGVEGRPNRAARQAQIFARGLVLGREVPAEISREAPLIGAVWGLAAVSQRGGVGGLPEIFSRVQTADQANLAVAVWLLVRDGQLDWGHFCEVVAALGHQAQPAIQAAFDTAHPLLDPLTGALFGARLGRAALDESQQWAVLSCRPHEGQAGVRYTDAPRDWPTDALVLAERLITAGDVRDA